MVLTLVILFIVLSIVVISLVLKISSGLNQRLNQMNLSLQEAYKVLGQNMGNTTSIFGGVQEKLTRLEETNRQIYEIGKDISSLQELLRAPKFRGQMGETMLENLLSQVLPKDHYQMQYHFKTTDTVDAVIKIGERLVCIDAKFSLENFQKFLNADDEQTKSAFRKKFIQDVKNRIGEVSLKYILPEENTYDFALMYIPAENVYYEAIITEDLINYSMSHKVIPVSPNTFYAYLQVICLGLKGFKIEENAKEILKGLGMLHNDLKKFKEDFDLVGTHLSNAGKKFDDSSKRLERLSDKLTNIQETKDQENKPAALEVKI